MCANYRQFLLLHLSTIASRRNATACVFWGHLFITSTVNLLLKVHFTSSMLASPITNFVRSMEHTELIVQPKIFVPVFFLFVSVILFQLGCIRVAKKKPTKIITRQTTTCSVHLHCRFGARVTRCIAKRRTP